MGFYIHKYTTSSARVTNERNNIICIHDRNMFKKQV